MRVPHPCQIATHRPRSPQNSRPCRRLRPAPRSIFPTSGKALSPQKHPKSPPNNLPRKWPPNHRWKRFQSRAVTRSRKPSKRFVFTSNTLWSTRPALPMPSCNRRPRTTSNSPRSKQRLTRRVPPPRSSRWKNSPQSLKRNLLPLKLSSSLSLCPSLQARSTRWSRSWILHWAKSSFLKLSVTKSSTNSLSPRRPAPIPPSSAIWSSCQDRSFPSLSLRNLRPLTLACWANS